MKKKDFSELWSLVYSTNPEINPGSFTPPPNEQCLHVGFEKKHRGGKTVTLIEGFEGKTEDLENLAKTLKTKCGAGGSVKDGVILIQGDCREKITKFLQEQGYKVK